MKIAFLVVAWAGGLVVALIQIAATAAGVEHLTELPSLLSWCIALLLGWTPLIGTAAGIYGAHAEWDWELLDSVLLFVGMPLVCLGLSAIAAVISEARERRS